MNLINSEKIEMKHWQQVVSNDPFRLVMTGVYFDLENGVMVATNSHLLLECPIELELEDNEKKLSHKDLIEKLRSLSKIVPIEFFDRRKYMGDPKFYVHQPMYDLSDPDYAQVWHCGEVVFRCRYIEGKFPNYRAVYPTETNQLDSIGVDMSMVLRIHKSIPYRDKRIYYKFFAKNKGIVFRSAENEKLKGIVMPTVEQWR